MLIPIKIVLAFVMNCAMDGSKVTILILNFKDLKSAAVSGGEEVASVISDVTHVDNVDPKLVTRYFELCHSFFALTLLCIAGGRSYHATSSAPRRGPFAIL